ncbi:alpha/beta fold hydrolase [Mangrovimonas sp. TPBH4]|uniref:alpha/beta fold hydrolase n=1 Tax=Mangrovimonas sp. TPBH4 TaxID=1645914 RepID=UPI0006B54BEF|nr:alpha/beta hydrolase [Mangrovimonas sp. TPBH4]
MRNLIYTILFLGSTILTAQTINQVDIDKGSMSYLTKGEGEIILFIHGAQEDYRVFLPQVELLSKQFKVVTYSRRYNFPNNNNLTGTYNAETESEDLKRLIEQLGGPVHLVGHSYGGLIAINFALNYPELTKTLIVSEPALIDWLKTMPECKTSYEDVQEHLIKETREAFKTKDTTMVMKELFEFFAGADLQDQVPPEVLTMLKENLREIEALVTSENGFRSPSCQSLKKLSIPIMIFTSNHTLPLLKCTNVKLVECLPNATHHYLEAAGHEMWLTHPEELSQYISAFLKD